jgi:pyruvate dehydrogenase E2 component (dihydrolipoamide acetyltransferase)
VLLHIGVEEGDTAAVDSILAILGEKGEDISGLLDGKESSESDSSDKDEKETKSSEDKKEESAKPDTEEEKADSEPNEAASDGDDRIKASPLAKKMAEEKGINLSEVKGSGDGGRIVKEDIENYSPKKTETTSSAQNASGADSNFEEVKVSQMRKTIAKRLAESKYSAPHFYLTLDIDMDGAISARKAINEIAESKVSFNDMVIKAAAVALTKHPDINVSWMEDKIRVNKDINIGVAVAVDEGLVVPVVRHANQKGLSTINTEVKTFAGQAREKKLAPADMEGSTFSISNLGMFGIEEFTAIINPPNSCILAVGAIKQVPVVKDGAVVPGNMMRVTLSCDHRTVDGAKGAAFLQTFKGLIENPLNMLI